MSRHGNITLEWGDGEYPFRLGIKELRLVQETCIAGPPVIAQRLRDGTWLVDDIREPLRVGLIGAGMTQAQALTKIRTFVDERPLAENVLIAYAVMLAAIHGAPDEKVGKARRGRKKATDSQTERSPSPSSTVSVQ